MTQTNTVWVMNRHADGPMSDDNLVLREQPIPEPGEGEIRVRGVYLSLDPTNRVWLSPRYTYLPPIPLGDPMRGFIIGVVDKSRAPGWQEGDIAYGLMQWAQYSIINPDRTAFMMKMPAPTEVSLEASICALAMNAHTAYYGLLLKGQPRPGETVLISGAAGATGVPAGQIAKIAGCRVVGIAGGPEKCRQLVEDFGFDAAIDYKAENVLEAIGRSCPDGVDIFFDNVGGPILDAALVHLAMGARVVICGGISDYDNIEDPDALYGVKNHFMLLMRRARMEGFVVFDFLGGAEQQRCQRDLTRWFQDGRLKYQAHVVEGIEHAFPSLKLLFNGGNRGKLLVKLDTTTT
jgi:NADPH-dependent curcumin reductase CurA